MNMNEFDDRLVIINRFQIVSTQLILLETWKQIPDFPAYEVSTFGNVRKDKKLKRLKKTNRYRQIALDYKGIGLHILMAVTFIGPRSKRLVVNHIDGNSGNNRLDNLEYLTYSGNSYHGKIIHNHSSTYDQKEYIIKYKEEQKKTKRILNQTKRRVKNEKEGQYNAITSIYL